jgi:nucleotide-binding universal stress UspA family protein
MSIQVKRILVAKDLSKEASNVIRYALELGSKFDAQVHVLHVMPTVDHAVLNMVAIAMGPDKLAKFNTENEASLAEQTRKQLNEILEDEKKLADFDLKKEPQIEVHHGEPAPMILTVADRIDADLIILGSHSKGRLHYAFLGSVAEKILRKSQRAVFIVPPVVGM